MNWINKIKDLKVGHNVLIQLKDSQYLAGTFQRRENSVYFLSSDGAWSIQVDSIKRFCYIV